MLLAKIRDDIMQVRLAKLSKRSLNDLKINFSRLIGFWPHNSNYILDKLIGVLKIIAFAIKKPLTQSQQVGFVENLLSHLKVLCLTVS